MVISDAINSDHAAALACDSSEMVDSLTGYIRTDGKRIPRKRRISEQWHKADAAYRGFGQMPSVRDRPHLSYRVQKFSFESWQSRRLPTSSSPQLVSVLQLTIPQLKEFFSFFRTGRNLIGDWSYSLLF